MYGINPFSAQNATRDVDPNHIPSIFGALPFPGTPESASASPATLVALRFTAFDPTILDSKVVGSNGETFYRVSTNNGHTVLQTRGGGGGGQATVVARVAWQDAHPTLEAHALTTQHVGRWLQLSPDKRARTMLHGGVYYVWMPIDRYLHLFAPDSNEWLARVTKSADAVLLELTPRAVQLGLMDVAVLATLLLQCGKSID